eukprot:TRINITY_DN777913_c0_g1_i1.p1 TRINITY_DN777913_c0_g1~~TRINITY_DN777913_c0_g1_i1.p1  ORF type:complete len:317 (-),score=69.04 TRINITY_DN777913_c0_g1_i1:881-1831(-)
MDEIPEMIFCMKCASFKHRVSECPGVIPESIPTTKEDRTSDNEIIQQSLKESDMNDEIPSSIRIATLNVHCWEQGSKKLIEHIKHHNIDIICFQEAVLPNQCVDEKNYLFRLASELDMNVIHGPSAFGFGNSLLSKYPIVCAGSQKLHIIGSERRCFVMASIQTPFNQPLNVIGTHLDHICETHRIRQINLLEDYIEDTYLADDHFLIGDMNSLTKSDYDDDKWNEIARIRELSHWEPPHNDLTNKFKEEHEYDDSIVASKSKVPPVDSTCRFNTRIDYILHKGSKWSFVPGSYNVCTEKVSDHQMVYVDIEPNRL